MRDLGFVVVGLGRAGRARVRDLQGLPGCRLVGTVSQRPEAATLSLEQALRDPDVDIAVIATENARHAPLAAAFLQAGKHALVDFPLAQDAATARHLFDLAREHRLCLHTELIGLLTPDHAALQAACRNQPPRQLNLAFTGGFDGWLAQEASAGRWGNLAVARLHTLWDLARPLVLQDVAVQADSNGYLLQAHFAGQDDCQVQLREERRPGLARGRTLTGTLADGSPLPELPEMAQAGLFLRDLRACVERVRSGNERGAYVADAAVLAVLELADALSLTASRSSAG